MSLTPATFDVFTSQSMTTPMTISDLEMVSIHEMDASSYLAMNEETFECPYREPVQYLLNNVVGKSRGAFELSQEKSEKQIEWLKLKLCAYEFKILDVAKQTHISSRAVSTSYGKAKHKAAVKLLNLLERQLKVDKIHMPKHLIGLPNFRDHSYFIPVFVPLFWNKNFVASLDKALEIASKDKTAFKPYYTIKGLFEEYRKASFDPNFTQKNYPGTSQVPGKKPDLEIDKYMMKLLVKLREDNIEYATPGGNPTTFWKDVMRTLWTQFGDENPFEQALNFDFKTLLSCSACNETKTAALHQTFIPLKEKYLNFSSLNEIMANEKSFLLLDNFNCDNCKGSDFTIIKKKLSIPSILVFLIDGQVTDDLPNALNLELPDLLNVFGTPFEKYAYSISFFKYKVESSDIGRHPRHNGGEPGDAISGTHVVLNIKHEGVWREVNNDKILEPLRTYNYARNQMLIFYRKIE
ncbi:uncharacterized protein LOC107367966 [Tetranychus urticae]|uniref:USP domain-containing protein n=1 Tax=Tetranychus urticae TaxID=32264 RepID=T1KWE2_TETUR|nr:uncharacterized protein LOC107367966 [Tetranychus urticae]